MTEARESASAEGLGPLPLVIGISGHRDLRDEDRSALEAQVRGVLTDLRRRCPATPLWVLSSLAEGADRLAARVALECGARLVVPLPLPRYLYERDFATPQSKAEFADLLLRAEQVIEMPLLQGATLEDIRDDGEPRNQQYALAGAFVARHSQVLLALWDGVKSTPTGGTAETVRFQLEGVPEPYAPPQNLLDPVQGGPIFQIVTPRRSNPHPVGQPMTVQLHYPPSYENEAAARAASERIWRRVDTFNRDAVCLAASLATQREKSKACLFPPEEARGLPPTLHPLLDWFAIADTLAVHFQRLALGTLGLLLVLVFLAAFAFNAADPDWLGSRLLGRALYLLMLGSAYAAFVWAWWADYESKYLDYRALAEGLRVQLFWRLAGLPDSVADHYLRSQQSVLDWIRDAIRTWNMTTRPEPTGRLGLVQNRWVTAQHAYYVAATDRDQSRLQWGKWIGTGFFLIGLAWAGAKVLLGPPHRGIDSLEVLWLQKNLLHALVVFISLTPVIAALLYSYAQTRGLSEHAKQYGRMAGLFATAERQLRDLLGAGKEAEAQRLLLDLGKEALLENGDWVQLHRDRPIQVPR